MNVFKSTAKDMHLTIILYLFLMDCFLLVTVTPIQIQAQIIVDTALIYQRYYIIVQDPS